MRSETEFKGKQIVWAKVGDYPWWPAKVVKNIVQDNHKIYKVYFFGDPTYCYLQSQYLLDFQTGLTLYEQHYSTNLILKKSIQLAKTAYKKTISSQIELSTFQDMLHLENISYQQSKVSSNSYNQVPEKIEFNDKIQAQLKIQVPINIIQYSSINCQNVINFINSQIFKNLKNTKGYNNRKYMLLLESQVKKNLLQKYHLQNISKSIFIKKSASESEKNRKNKNNREKCKKIKKLKNRDILLFCAKKLHKIIKEYWNLQYIQSQQLVLKLIEALNEKWGKDKKTFSRNFMKIIQCIKHNYKSYESLEFIVESVWDINRKNGSFEENTLGMEEEFKKQDQEKSKVTQIEAETH